MKCNMCRCRPVKFTKWFLKWWPLKLFAKEKQLIDCIDVWGNDIACLAHKMGTHALKEMKRMRPYHDVGLNPAKFAVEIRESLALIKKNIKSIEHRLGVY